MILIPVGKNNEAFITSNDLGKFRITRNGLSIPDELGNKLLAKYGSYITSKEPLPNNKDDKKGKGTDTSDENNTKGGGNDNLKDATPELKALLKNKSVVEKATGLVASGSTLEEFQNEMGNDSPVSVELYNHLKGQSTGKET